MQGLLLWEQFDNDAIIRIVDALGIETTGSNAEAIYCYCPFHSNRSTRAAVINAETGYLYCFSCGIQKPLVEVVMDIQHCNRFEAVRFLHNYKQQQPTLDVDKLFNLQELSMFDTSTILELHGNLFYYDNAQQYLLNRNIDRAAWRKYKLGYSIKRDMIIIPVEHPWQPGYVGFVGRSTTAKQFKNSTGLPRKHVLFGLQHVGDTNHIYLTESALDAIMIDAAGKPAVASLGATISDQQLSLLSRWRDIIVVQDNDDAGEKMWRRVHSKLPKHNVRHIQWPDKTYNDVGESGVNYIMENLGG